MGGCNHQPCSKIAENSTRLSRHVSSATANIQLANVRLEDMLLVELDLELTDLGSITVMLSFLNSAKADFIKAQASATQMLGTLRSSNFIDCKDEKELDMIIESLCIKSMLNPYYAKMVKKDRCVGGFLTCLEKIHRQIKETGRLVSKLIFVFERLQKALQSSDEKVFSHLEFNSPLNIKPAFAQLYAMLGDLNGYFLASAIISTELFYEVAGLGALGTYSEKSNLSGLYQDFVKGDAIDRLVLR